MILVLFRVPLEFKKVLFKLFSKNHVFCVQTKLKFFSQSNIVPKIVFQTKLKRKRTRKSHLKIPFVNKIQSLSSSAFSALFFVFTRCLFNFFCILIVWIFSLCFRQKWVSRFKFLINYEHNYTICTACPLQFDIFHLGWKSTTLRWLQWITRSFGCSKSTRQ